MPKNRDTKLTWEDGLLQTDAQEKQRSDGKRKKILEAKLDAAAIRYSTLTDPKDSAMRESAKMEALQLIMELYDKYADVLGDLSLTVFCDTFEKFDASLGQYSHYYSRSFAHKKKEIFYRRGQTDPIEQENEDGEDWETADVQQKQAEQSEIIEENFAASSYILLELVSMILNIQDGLKGRANNETRRRYFQMFYTDNLAYAIQEEKHPEAYLMHERDMFAASELPFLDFFLRQKCRTVRQLSQSVTKLYGEMVPGREMKQVLRGEIKRLPNDVYTTCLSREYHYESGDSAVSMQWKAYQSFVSEYFDTVGVRHRT